MICSAKLIVNRVYSLNTCEIMVSRGQDLFKFSNQNNDYLKKAMYMSIDAIMSTPKAITTFVFNSANLI